MIMKKKKESTDNVPAEGNAPTVKNAPVAAPVNEDFRGIVRIAGKDVLGHVPLKRALIRVRGVGHTMSGILADIINTKLSISPDTQVGSISEQQVEKIDYILSNAQEYNLPKYLFNRQSDVFDGSSKHLIMNDLLFALKQDVEREKKLYTWKGYRHAYGQKVRGQRTRNTGRSGLAVGVLRKAILAQQKPAAAGGAPAAAAPAAGKGAAAPAAKAGAAPAGKPAAAAPAAAKPAAKPASK